MRLIFGLLIALALLMGGARECRAEMGVAKVTPAMAKEWGMQVRATANGPNEFWVELEFRPEGRFKNFSHVSLEIQDGKKLLLGYTALRENRTSSGTIKVNFLANRDYLEKVTLRVVTGVAMDRNGYDLRVKEFVEPDGN
jgi:hypothetical protein